MDRRRALAQTRSEVEESKQVVVVVFLIYLSFSNAFVLLIIVKIDIIR